MKKQFKGILTNCSLLHQTRRHNHLLHHSNSHMEHRESSHGTWTRIRRMLNTVTLKTVCSNTVTLAHLLHYVNEENATGSFTDNTHAGILAVIFYHCENSRGDINFEGGLIAWRDSRVVSVLDFRSSSRGSSPAGRRWSAIVGQLLFAPWAWA